MSKVSVANWKLTAKSLAHGSPSGFRTLKTYCAILDYIHKNDWQGACHSSSSILATLLAAQCIPSALCLGEVFQNGHYFDHSWIEIEGEVFDAAISNTLIRGFAFPPVFRGIDLSTKHPCSLVYGKPSGEGYDESASWIRNTPVADYMEMFSGHPSGLFGIAKKIAKTIGLQPSLSSLKKHAREIQWVEKP